MLDSPFGRLKDLMVELCEEQKLPIPRAFMRIALSMMRRSVRKRANFNVDDVSPLDVVPGSFIPALFGEHDFTKHMLCDCMQSAHAHCVCQYSQAKLHAEGLRCTERPSKRWRSAVVPPRIQPLLSFAVASNE